MIIFVHFYFPFSVHCYIIIYSWKINRISRKLEDVLKIVNLLENNNISFKSYSEPFETNTPAGKMQFQMMALIGEFERGTIAQNVKMGMCAKARAGEWCGGRVLGYDLVPVENQEGTKRRKTKLTINEIEDENLKVKMEELKYVFNEFNSRLHEGYVDGKDIRLLLIN